MIDAAPTSTAPSTGYAPVDGLEMYYEIHGAGEPLVLVHGGLGSTGMYGELLPRLAEIRQVIAVDLQAHGRTADIAAVIAHLGFERAAVMGYSLSGGAALRAAIQHPEVVDRLVLVSTAHKRAGWYPEVRAAMAQLSGAAAEVLKPSPMYQNYVAVAPQPENFPALLDKVAALLRRDYDWSRDVAAITAPTLLVFGDADSISPVQAAAFFELLGGGQGDAGWDGSGMTQNQLAILSGTTHYGIFFSPALADAVTPFLGAPRPASWQ